MQSQDCKVFQKRILCVVILLLVFSGASAKSLTISLKPMFKELPLILNTKSYVTDAGDTVKITQLKMYISRVSLSYLGKPTSTIPDSYYLLNLEKDSTLSIVLEDVPKGKLAAVSFSIGVDSATSCSGAMAGDLDPMNGMYWAWNSGYINAKMEGISPSCKTHHNSFQFHIGGYNGPDKSIQHVSLEIGSDTKIRRKTLFLDMDVSVWFGAIDLAVENSITSPGKKAVQMANRYKDMFSISEEL